MNVCDKCIVEVYGKKPTLKSLQHSSECEECGEITECSNIPLSELLEAEPKKT